ncbi:MAG: glutamine--fructose-6-phosphate transaminase (isomerizing) [Candidatus Zambryskibacteria bacterium]|nr:glutamine--fructose-6-phosphate transaminase (isomerizing) [Candidatus Zambryskibacteria bacterium]
MCGIIGYIGKRNAPDIVIDALKRAETRGYHGFGVAVSTGNKFEIRKKGGEDCLGDFLELVSKSLLPKSSYAFGHNRWATHGTPEDRNAHPHLSQSGRLAIVHNGIIENYSVLKNTIEKETGVSLKLISDTDTEVLVNWIEYVQKLSKLSLKEAMKSALENVEGTFAFIVASLDEPGVFVGAVRGRTMRIGVGEHEGEKEFFIASEVYPFSHYTQTYVVIPSHKLISVTKDGYIVEDTRTGLVETPELKKLEITLHATEKGEYKYWMDKEIHEQPRMIENVLQGRVDLRDKSVILGGIKEYEKDLANASILHIVAHGTSFNSALLFKYWCEAIAGIPVNVELASEFRYRKTLVSNGSFVIGISQSGETADTIVALEHAQELGATILGICNVEGSHMSEMTDAGIFLRAGRELGVASTKTFTAQMAVGMMLSLHLARIKGVLPEGSYQELFEELQSLPLYIEEVLSLDNPNIKLALELLKNASSAYYIGRGVSYPIALEGALKIKEIAGIHAEGYAASEMKHGPIGLLDKHMPVVAIATSSSQIDKMISNIKEAQARKAPVIALVTRGNPNNVPADIHIELPEVREEFSPFINILPLQILAFRLALMKGKNPDKPEGLAKSITVE